MSAAFAPQTVIPAKAGIQTLSGFEELPMKDWTPAFAGVTRASFGTVRCAATQPLFFWISSPAFLYCSQE